MSEGKTIREHIEYYDKFMIYYNGREACRRIN